MTGLEHLHDASDINFVRGFSCDTEVKTNHGWKRIEDVDAEQDALLAASLETLELHYTKPTTIDTGIYEGPMLHFDTAGIDLLLTSDAFVYAHRRTISNGELLYLPKLVGCENGVSESDRLPVSGFQYCSDKDGTFILPGLTIVRRGKEVTIPPREIDMKAWLEFFGFWLADGCWRSPRQNGKVSYDVYIKQNAENEEYVLDLIRGIGFIPKIEHYRAGGYNNYCIHSRQLWEYLRQFGKSADKYIPEEFLMLAPEYLEALFRGYTNGDSTMNRTAMELSSKSRRLMDNVQELVLKLEGSVTQIREKKRKLADGTPTTLWLLRYVPNRTHKVRTSYGKPQKVDYYGKIYKPQMEESKLILLRRNGTIMWAAC